ncbi:MAG TPA: hypothetical protein DCW68_06820 [Rhodospirillaceae bacterium]|nr:MAG: hypothetical protein A2018_01330 [Alphaproteobacteria bacterium GWF2_58_20]HAU29800.1 hypothetical protein [Rhodospirillaceae bacterium]
MTGPQLADMSPRVAVLRHWGRRVSLCPLSLAQLGGLAARHPCMSGIFTGHDIFDSMVVGGRPVLHEVLALAAGMPAKKISRMHLRPRKLLMAVADVLAMTMPDAVDDDMPSRPAAPSRMQSRDMWPLVAARLVSMGHHDPLRYSPRQALAWLAAGENTRKADLKDQASAMLVASRGDKRDIQKFMEQ